MSRIEELILGLVGDLIAEVGDEEGTVRVRVDRVDLTVPIEAGLGQRASMLATTPRHRLETGFQPQLGALALHLERRDG